MSPPQISRSPDLKRLQDDGFEVVIHGGWLVIDNVPYVDHEKRVRRGKLVAQLALANDTTVRPPNHVVHFVGEDDPCDPEGRPLHAIINQRVQTDHGGGLISTHRFSSKPVGAGRYDDYYEKMTAYVAMVSGPAEAIDPDATARTFKVVENPDQDSPFLYADTATSRAGIDAATAKMRLERVAIVGLGGTGAYILDLVAKVPVREIHLYDGDWFIQHNAFRAPGAASAEEMSGRPSKVEYLAASYSRMRRGIVPHPDYVDESNVDELCSMDFVFLALDKGTAKELIVAKLCETRIPFIDVGLGVLEDDGSIGGILQITTSTAEMPAAGRSRISFSDGDEENDYSQNIQIADLNALNAALAVVKWKKLFGFYRDIDREHYSAYSIDGNHLLNEDTA